MAGESEAALGDVGPALTAWRAAASCWAASSASALMPCTSRCSICCSSSRSMRTARECLRGEGQRVGLAAWMGARAAAAAAVDGGAAAAGASIAAAAVADVDACAVAIMVAAAAQPAARCSRRVAAPPAASAAAAACALPLVRLLVRGVGQRDCCGSLRDGTQPWLVCSEQATPHIASVVRGCG